MHIFYLNLFKTGPFNFGDEREVTIMFWTRQFGRNNIVHDGTETFFFVNGFAQGMFDECTSPINRCKVTNNRSLLSKSEAVIFHAQDLDDIEWPDFRSPDQRWIYFNVESPQHTNSKELLKNLPKHLYFNWTLTYR